MLEISEEITAFLLAQAGFTSVMGQRISPYFAKESTTFPFATYRINEQNASSKDGKEATVALMLWFDPNKYKACAQATDAIKNIIETEYDWESSTIDFIEDNQSFVGIINFKKY
jgi:hypothetical protein